MTDTTYYAIGDIHGEAERLTRLYQRIAEDSAGADATLIHLGDLIDRGPESRAVVELAMQMEHAASSITLMGNHERMMIDAYDRVDTRDVTYWAMNGGEETLASYEAANGRQSVWRDAIDKPHIAWLRDLPTLWRDEARKIAFVHGGIDPARFPDCDPMLRLWTRSNNFFDIERWPRRKELDGWMVVHGHTPTDDFKPDVSARRINVDTGVCYGGPLTCVVLAPGAAPRFLAV